MLRASKAEFSLVLLILTLAFSAFALIEQANRARSDVIERAFSNAEDLVGFVVVANRHYIQSTSGLPIELLTPDPEAQPNRAWMPATFATRYTKAYSARNPGVDFRIYSRDPFSFQSDRVLDVFAEDALDALLPGGVASFRAIEEVGDGYKRVRLARAFEMDANCTACHNRPEWGLQNQNWQIGDVRGIWEASVLVSPTNLHTPTEIIGLFALTATSLALGLFVVFPAVRREVSKRKFFYDRSLSLEETADLNLQQAHTDVLTDIGNRRFFDHALDEMLQDRRETGQPVSLIILDIDHFKRVNDTHGHDVGDTVICMVADVLRGETGSHDRIARIGGEEFVILTPDADPRSVTELANRIRDRVAAREAVLSGGRLRVTISAGVAFLQENETGRSLLKRADDLLYQAKNTGRDKVCIAEAA